VISSTIRPSTVAARVAERAYHKHLKPIPLLAVAPCITAFAWALGGVLAANEPPQGSHFAATTAAVIGLGRGARVGVGSAASGGGGARQYGASISSGASGGSGASGSIFGLGSGNSAAGVAAAAAAASTWWGVDILQASNAAAAARQAAAAASSGLRMLKAITVAAKGEKFGKWPRVHVPGYSAGYVDTVIMPDVLDIALTPRHDLVEDGGRLGLQRRRHDGGLTQEEDERPPLPELRALHVLEFRMVLLSDARMVRVLERVALEPLLPLPTLAPGRKGIA
jgi:hypothetical protein